jgi:hypothetical protein
MKTSTVTHKLDFATTEALLRDLASAWGYDPMALTDAQKREIGANIARFMGRAEPLSRSYVTNMLAGRTGSEAIRTAVMGLLAVADGARVEQVKTHPVQCLTEHNVHAGALILTDSRLCVCGLSFIPRCWNQKYHAAECRKLRIK